MNGIDIIGLEAMTKEWQIDELKRAQANIADLCYIKQAYEHRYRGLSFFNRHFTTHGRNIKTDIKKIDAQIRYVQGIIFTYWINL